MWTSPLQAKVNKISVLVTEQNLSMVYIEPHHTIIYLPIGIVHSTRNSYSTKTHIDLLAAPPKT